MLRETISNFDGSLACMIYFEEYSSLTMAAKPQILLGKCNSPIFQK